MNFLNSMIDKKTVQVLEKKLLDEEKRLKEELLSFADRQAKGDYSTRYVDFGDSEDDNVEEYRQHDFNLSLERKFEEELTAVRKALAKIKADQYGLCSQCGQPINPKRLQAYPAAAICMKCSANVGK